MNKPLIIHGAWSLVAMASFAIGYQVFPPQAGAPALAVSSVGEQE